jgi:hypothetical protein
VEGGGSQHGGRCGKRNEELGSKANVGKQKADGQTVQMAGRAALHLTNCYTKRVQGEGSVGGGEGGGGGGGTPQQRAPVKTKK